MKAAVAIFLSPQVGLFLVILCIFSGCSEWYFGRRWMAIACFAVAAMNAIALFHFLSKSSC